MRRASRSWSQRRQRQRPEPRQRRRRRTLLIAIPNAFEAGQAVEQARHLNARLTIIARAHSDEEVTYLHDLGANEVIMGEREIGLGMLSLTEGRAELAMTAAGVETMDAARDAGAALPPAPLGRLRRNRRPPRCDCRPARSRLVTPLPSAPAALEIAPEISKRASRRRIEHDVIGPAERPRWFRPWRDAPKTAAGTGSARGRSPTKP